MCNMWCLLITETKILKQRLLLPISLNVQKTGDPRFTQESVDAGRGSRGSQGPSRCEMPRVLLQKAVDHRAEADRDADFSADASNVEVVSTETQRGWCKSQDCYYVCMPTTN